MKQIRFYDIYDENESFGGILLDNGDVICGCCGSLIEKDDVDKGFITIEKIYDKWIGFSDAIK